jgi:hypothetical protein
MRSIIPGVLEGHASPIDCGLVDVVVVDVPKEDKKGEVAIRIGLGEGFDRIIDLPAHIFILLSQGSQFAT